MLNIICNKITDGVLTSTAVNDVTRSEAVTAISGGLPQSVNITVYASSGDNIELDTSNIIQDTFTINRSCASSGSLEVGSVMAAQLDFEINNSSNEFNAAIFEGKRLYAELSTPKIEITENNKVITTWYVIPLGYFNIDEVRRTKKSIIITALDDMTKFDKSIPTDFVNGRNTVADLIFLTCQNCGVTFNDTLGILDEPCFVNNFNYVPKKITFDNNSTTYRQLLSWCCQILGKNAYIDSSGKLQIKWFSESGVLFRPSQCFEMERNESAIKVTGVKKTVEEKDYLYGSDDYALNLTENQLINHSINGVLEGIYKEISVPVSSGEGTVYEPFSYHPFTATFLPSVFFEPMDKFSYMTTMTGSSEDQIQLAITDVTIAINANTVLNGTGDTQTIFNYGDLPVFSSAQQSVIDKKAEQTKDEVSKDIKQTTEDFKSETLKAAADFNKVISNGMGLYQISETDSAGNTIYVYCNAETVAKSTYIMKLDTSGFAFAKSDTPFNVSNSALIQEWTYGINSEGNAVLNYLLVNKLTADYINVLNANIGGFTIKNGYLRYGSDDNTLLNHGTNGENGFFVYPGGYSEKIGNYTNLALGLGKNFFVQSNGELYASNAHIDGKITATSGEIAGFEIADSNTAPSNGFWKNSLSSVNNNGNDYYAVFLRNTGASNNIAFGVRTINKTTKPTSADWSSVDAKYVLAVANNGKLTATNAEITGKVTATSGSFECSDGSAKTIISNGSAKFYNSSNLYGELKAVVDTNINASKPCFVIQSNVTNSAGIFITSNANNSWYAQYNSAYKATELGDSFKNETAYHVYYGNALFKNKVFSDTVIANYLTARKELSAPVAKISTVYCSEQFIMDAAGKYVWGAGGTGVDDYQRLIGVTSSNNIAIGSPSNVGNLNLYAGKNKKIQLQSAAYTSDSVAVTSDRNAKYDFKDFTDVHTKLFDLIEPKIFKYKHGTSGRSHFGLIAQDFEQAILDVGLTTQDVAAIIKDTDIEPGEYEYSIRYSELIPLIIYRLKIVLNDLEKIKNELAERTET